MKKRTEKVREAISRSMKGKNIGEKNPKYKNHFYMIDTKTGQRWRFASTHECAKFGRDELKLTLVHSTVWKKLNGKSPVKLYDERYEFIFEQSAIK